MLLFDLAYSANASLIFGITYYRAVPVLALLLVIFAL